jgi:hypothetical protein
MKVFINLKRNQLASQVALPFSSLHPNLYYFQQYCLAKLEQYLLAIH